ncbi:hypothetical protein CCMA1212_005114 [Trichoderma ghanense]|uniref:Uncharacterized protein n=1 Tax=Trichoderma ghanense TaxID=65468 RepID=A0ABY2H428_9HYPO
MLQQLDDPRNNLPVSQVVSRHHATTTIPWAPQPAHDLQTTEPSPRRRDDHCLRQGQLCSQELAVQLPEAPPRTLRAGREEHPPGLHSRARPPRQPERAPKAHARRQAQRQNLPPPLPRRPPQGRRPARRPALPRGEIRGGH